MSSNLVPRCCDCGHADADVRRQPSDGRFRCDTCVTQQRQPIYADIGITCACGAVFWWTVGEQEFYMSRNLNTPKRCPACRERRKGQAALPQAADPTVNANFWRAVEWFQSPEGSQSAVCNLIFKRLEAREGGRLELWSADAKGEFTSWVLQMFPHFLSPGVVYEPEQAQSECVQPEYVAPQYVQPQYAEPQYVAPVVPQVLPPPPPPVPDVLFEPVPELPYAAITPDIQQLLDDAFSPIEYRRRTFWEWLTGQDPTKKQLARRARAAQDVEALIEARTELLETITEMFLKAAECRQRILSSYLAELEIRRRIAEEQQLAWSRIQNQGALESFQHYQRVTPPPPPSLPPSPHERLIGEHRDELRARATVRRATIADVVAEVEQIFGSEMSDGAVAASIRSVLDVYQQDERILRPEIQDFLEDAETYDD